MRTHTLVSDGISVEGLGPLNILLGRNGAGKSRLLQSLDAALMKSDEHYVRYVSPERAGVFRRDGSVITNMERRDTWLADARRKNQAQNFKAASAQLLRDVETAYLRRMQDTPALRLDVTRTFHSDRLDRINRLLTNIRIDQEQADFVFKSLAGESLPPENISSGESEATSLATEIMHFFDTLHAEKTNVLLLDEPDVHLHPDLQARLVDFVIQFLDDLEDAERARVVIVIATHSTPLVCAAAACRFAKVGTKRFGSGSVPFQTIDSATRKIGPFLGHPLSLSLSSDVILIVEGDDDVRVWQQAARSSHSRISVFPVRAVSVDVQGEMEVECDRLLTAICDDPRAYSIRDGDGVSEALAPVGCVIRFRLQCYAIENALVTDECLKILELDWEGFRTLARSWMADNPSHRDIDNVRELITAEDRLRHRKVKDIRQLICGIAGSRRPWEVVVGQAIASLSSDEVPDDEPRLASYLGRALTRTIVAPAVEDGLALS